MSRARVAWLALLGALIVFEDGRNGPPAAETTMARAPTLAGSRPVDAGEMAAYLRELNPRLSDRQLARISSAVVKYGAKYDLDPDLVVAVIAAESSVRPWARSPKGAIGLMQVMPYMMGSLEVVGNPTSIESNIEAGCMILADNIRRLGESQGILAYFWGSEIRGASYLQRVQQARAALRRKTAS